MACAQLTPRYRRESDARAELGGVISCAEATSLYGAAVAEAMPARLRAPGERPAARAS